MQHTNGVNIKVENKTSIFDSALSNQTDSASGVDRNKSISTVFKQNVRFSTENK